MKNQRYLQRLAHFAHVSASRESIGANIVLAIAARSDDNNRVLSRFRAQLIIGGVSISAVFLAAFS